MANKTRFKKEKNIKQRYYDSVGWSFTVQIRYVDVKGEKKTYSKTYNEKECGSAKEAFNASKLDRDKFYIDLKNNVPIIDKNNINVKECFEKALGISDNSYETKRKKILTFNKWINSDVQYTIMQRINANDIQKTLATASLNGASQNIIDDLVTIWKQIVNYALKDDIIMRDLMVKIDVPKIRKPVDVKDVNTDLQTINKVIESLRQRTMTKRQHIYDTEIIIFSIKLMYYTGMRPSECYALQRKHVDLDNNVIHIRQSLGSSERCKSVIRDTKTSSGVRDIPIIAECKKVLVELLQFNKNDFIFSDYYGKLFNTTAISNKIYRCCKYDNIDFNLYRLRHNLATSLISNNVDPRTVKEIMGHEDTSMTIEHHFI